MLASKEGRSRAATKPFKFFTAGSFPISFEGPFPVTHCVDYDMDIRSRVGSASGGGSRRQRMQHYISNVVSVFALPFKFGVVNARQSAATFT